MEQKKMIVKSNLVGKKFNKLLVLEIIPRSLYKRTKFKCKCDCGNEIIVEGSKLKNGHTKSCGCIKQEIDYGKSSRGIFGESSRKSLISSYKDNAKRKNIEFNLTDDEMTNLFQLNCFYCGSEPKNIYTRKNLFGFYIYNGIDRKNNNLGYTLDNVVPCCTQCNYIKHTFNYDDFVVWIKKVYENLNN